MFATPFRAKTQYFRHIRQIADINGFEFEQCCSLNTGLSQLLFTILEFRAGRSCTIIVFFSFGVSKECVNNKQTLSFLFQVTDLRVRLHKKMKMKEMAGGGEQLPSHPPPPPQMELLSQSAKQRLKRTLEQGLQPEEEEEVEDFEEILGPLEPSKKRKVVPPGSRLEFCVGFAILGSGFAVNTCIM